MLSHILEVDLDLLRIPNVIKVVNFIHLEEAFERLLVVSFEDMLLLEFLLLKEVIEFLLVEVLAWIFDLLIFRFAL